MKKKKCHCLEVHSSQGLYLFTDRSDCFLHSPKAAAHNARLDRMLAKIEPKDDQTGGQINVGCSD